MVLASGARHAIPTVLSCLLMRVFSASVRKGSIVTDGPVDLPDGSKVTVVVDSDELAFDVTAAEEAELLDAIGEADRGEVVPAADVLRRLAR